jgi:dethiobiotin synthetase
MMRSFAIVGIHTGIGKTITSAIFAQGLKMDYWKPVQAGNLDATDTMEVQRLVTDPTVQFHPEVYRLKAAISPHAAAAKEGLQIDAAKLVLPAATKPVIVETAGGLMSPISHEITNLDLIKSLRLPVVLVSRTYLGSINHTMLTWEVLRLHNIEILGIVFNGIINQASEEFILQHTGLQKLLNIEEETNLDKDRVRYYASLLSPHLSHES